MKSLLALSLAMTLAASSDAAFAQKQTQPPARVDNIWGGYAHQPTEAEVLQQEKSAGIAVPQQRQKATNDEVDSIYQNLMHDTNSAQ